MSYLNTALFLLAGIQLVAFIAQSFRTLHFARLGTKYLALYHDTAAQLTTMSEQYMDAAKLIDIKRQGRSNIFTFARGEKFFIIETMGLMADTPDLWRHQAGLTLQHYQDSAKPARDPLHHGEELTLDGQKFIGVVDHQDGTGFYWTQNGNRI